MTTVTIIPIGATVTTDDGKVGTLRHIEASGKWAWVFVPATASLVCKPPAALALTALALTALYSTGA